MKSLFLLVIWLICVVNTLAGAETVTDAFSTAGGEQSSANYNNVMILGQAAPLFYFESISYSEMSGFLNVIAMKQTETSVVDTREEPLVPISYALYQNFPNPFNPNTEIIFDIPEDCNMKLTIYNLYGQLVNTLYSGPIKVGRHSIIWNGCDLNGRKVASGVYLYKFEAKHFLATRKLILTK